MMTEQTTLETLHVFEKAGLGRAPFRFVGFTVEKYQANPGDPNCPIQPGTSCDYCGQGIMNVCHIKSADGKRFKVGCDCVHKTGDAGLRKVVDATVRKHERDVRHLREAAKIKLVTDFLADQTNRDALTQQPHPMEWAANQGKTMLDYAVWMLRNSGATGKIKLGKLLGCF